MCLLPRPTLHSDSEHLQSQSVIFLCVTVRKISCIKMGIIQISCFQTEEYILPLQFVSCFFADLKGTVPPV
jgi:hypothetical protein